MNYKPSDLNKTYLVTGAAGFIGYFLSRKLLEQGCQVVCVDNLNDYYDVELKQARLDQLRPFDKFTFIKGDNPDKSKVMEVFEEYLIYASSSSVYGANKKDPFEESDFVDTTLSLYASTKKSNELMAFTYSHLYKNSSLAW